MKYFSADYWVILFCSLASTSYSQTFTEVSQLAGINHFIYSPSLIGGGCAFFDYNNDGWLDIYIVGGLNQDKLYRNNGDGSFTDVAASAGLYAAGLFYTQGVVTGDIDNDGNRDIFVTTLGDNNDWAEPVRNILYRNNGNGTFTDIAAFAGLTDSTWSVSASMGDYNLDGYLDIYVGNYVAQTAFIRHPISNEIIGFAHTGFEDYLYLNNGNNTFTQIAPQLQTNNAGTTLATAFSDFDNDSDMDIYVANDFGEWVIPNVLYRNEYPLDSFTDVSAASGANAGIYGMGIAVGDYNEDGNLDYYITNIGRNVLYQNNGNGTFSDVTDSAGVINTYTPDSLFTTSWGTAFFDYDNNTWLDLFVSNGQIPAVDIIATGVKDPHKLFRNNMDGTFTDVSALEGVSDSTKGRGFATGDYDNDGDLDMLVACTHQFQNGAGTKVLLYRNDQANGNHWLKVNVQGTVNAHDAFGTRIEVYAGGRKWLREIDGGSSHASQNSSTAHFGLGSYAQIDSLVVIWLGGNRFTLYNLTADQTLTIIENGQSIVQQDVFVEICAGDSVLAGGAFQTTAGEYSDTFPLAGNIDSIVITHLTVHQNELTTRHFDVCDGDSILLNGIYFHADTLLTDSLTSVFGCDSIVLTEIIFQSRQVAIADALICEGDSIFAGGAWQTQSGTYYDTIPAGALCDHVLITALGVIPAIEPDTLQAFICTGDSLLAGGAYQTAEGFYANTFTVPFGCDSVVVTDLKILNHDPITQTLTTCAGDSIFAGGAFQTTAGIYYDSLLNANGCDSLIISELNFYASYSADTSLIIADGDSAFIAGGWQTEAGTYTDMLTTANGCDSILTWELIVESVGIETISQENFQLHVYPNPANSNFTVSYFLQNEETVCLKLLDISGKEALRILDKKITVGTHQLEISNSTLAPGMYLLTFRTSSRLGELKLILY